MIKTRKNIKLTIQMVEIQQLSVQHPRKKRWENFVAQFTLRSVSSTPPYVLQNVLNEITDACLLK